MAASSRNSNKKRALDEVVEPTEEDDAPSPKRQKIDHSHSNNNDDDADAEEEEANEKLMVGPMSPRMLYRLLVCAETSYDMARDEGDRFTKFRPEYDFDACLSDYLPVRFRFVPCDGCLIES